MTTVTDTPPATRNDRKVSFTQLQANVGERLQVLVQRFPAGRPITSALVGWIEGEFLLVRRPTDDKGPVPLVVGDNVTVRLFTGTEVAEFASTVQRVFGVSFPYIHLDYPSQVRALTLRAEPRVAVDLPAAATIDGSEGEITVRVRDINLRGARVQAPQALGAPGTRLTLRIAGGSGDDKDAAAPAADGEGTAAATAVAFSAEVRSARPMSAEQPDGACACGLKFDELGEEQQAFLRELTARHAG